ncbi:MAG TPA: hypothetical protein VJS88_07160, partial [Chthoniobacterales bacterium]|nr:hypothetical protein [Chthoniobacterales bacterium]
MPGINAEGGPMAAALEDYAHRAYPATEVPMDVTRRATQSWQAFQAAHSNRVNATDVNPPLLNWNLFGPSVLNSPAVLTFSGAPATISGRITAMALDSTCDANVCRMWIAAAGGGIWRTNNVHDATPSWTFVSGSFATNAIGTLTFAGGVLYAGTGEPNASADSEAGFGIYKSLDGGNTWTHLASQTTVPQGAGVDCTAVGFAGAGVLNAPAYSGPAFDGRAVSQIVVDPSNPNTLYVGSARAARGLSSTSSGGVFTIVPGFPPFGLWKSTDAGATFTLLNYEDVCLNPALPANGGISQSSFGSSRGVHAVAIDP